MTIWYNMVQEKDKNILRYTKIIKDQAEKLQDLQLSSDAAPQAVPSWPACPASSPKARNSWKLCLVKRQQSSCSFKWFLSRTMKKIACGCLVSWYYWESLEWFSCREERERERDKWVKWCWILCCSCQRLQHVKDTCWSCVSNLNRTSRASSWYVIMGKESFQAPLQITLTGLLLYFLVCKQRLWAWVLILNTWNFDEFRTSAHV